MSVLFEIGNRKKANKRMEQFIKGMDLSTLLEVERMGAVFYDHGRRGDAMDILKEYGMNLVRLRLWNDPYDAEGNPYGAGVCDLETMLALAKRAKEKGVEYLLDFHYSDFWADPGKQIPPKAWQNMDAAQLARAVYEYTRAVLARCRAEKALPRIVAVGNEISNGLLWPHGKTPNYRNIAALVSAGVRAVREENPEIQVMLHLDNGGNQELYRTWFDQYFANGGEDFEYIGLSYYPFWHGPLSGLKENMCDLALRYGKRLVVAEVSMGYTMEDYRAYEHLTEKDGKGMATKEYLTEKIDYPMTRQGQADFMRDVCEAIRSVPGALGRGFIYWEPAWVPVSGSGWATEAGWTYVHENGPGGNEWANQALFDYEGNALPALEVIRDFEGSSLQRAVGKGAHRE